jgi:SAM-dependent methyltransferase
MLRKIARQFLKKNWRRKISFVLPPKSSRFCTEDWQDDAFYFSSALQEVARQTRLCGLDDSARFVDIGSGQGRLAIGLQAMFPRLKSYTGLDVHAPSIDWCNKNLRKPNFSFIHVNTANERYNPSGAQQARLPVADHSADVIFLYSVFTHMRLPDIDAHLGEISRIISPAGSCFLTIYAEDWPTAEQENPPGYLSELGEHLGALHRVVINKKDFSEACARHQLTIRDFYYRCEGVTKQSALVLIPSPR